MKKVLALFLIVPLLICSCVNTSQTSENGNENTYVKNEKVIAVWLSFFEISELCKGKNEKMFRDEIINLAANLLTLGVNTLIVHAISHCDSFYESSVLPKSKYLKTDGKYDVFGTICEICSSADIDVQAWINPYRVSSDNGINEIEQNPAVKRLYESSERNILVLDSGIYLNPASIEIQRFIIECAREIIGKYDVCAIHIDDYFYPDMSQNKDKSDYENYIKSGGNLSLENWRRENINALISSLHSLTSSYNRQLAISPCADIEKNFNLKYADISRWLENGWADEIIPQIYFGFENENAPFEEMLEEWLSATKGKNTRLIVGLAFYKCGRIDPNAGSGKNEWIENCDIIARQIRRINSESTIYGVAFFSYSHIFGKKVEKNAKKELQNTKNVI